MSETPAPEAPKTISPENRKAIILTAIQVAGKGASDADVASEVKRAVGLLRDGSPAHAAFDELDRQAENTVSIHHVKGTVIGVGIESLSKGVQRGIIMLRTAVTSRSPEGKEHFRSDILGDEQDSPARVLMRQAKDLVGTQVIIEKHLEKKADGSGETVRVVRGTIKPLSADENYDIGNPDYQPFYADEKFAKYLSRADMRPRVPALV